MSQTADLVATSRERRTAVRPRSAVRDALKKAKGVHGGATESVAKSKKILEYTPPRAVSPAALGQAIAVRRDALTTALRAHDPAAPGVASSAPPPPERNASRRAAAGALNWTCEAAVPELQCTVEAQAYLERVLRLSATELAVTPRTSQFTKIAYVYGGAAVLGTLSVAGLGAVAGAITVAPQIAAYLAANTLAVHMNVFMGFATLLTATTDPRKTAWRAAREVIAQAAKTASQAGLATASVTLAGIVAGPFGPIGVCIAVATVQAGSQALVSLAVSKVLLYDDAAYAELAADALSEQEIARQEALENIAALRSGRRPNALQTSWTAARRGLRAALTRAAGVGDAAKGALGAGLIASYIAAPVVPKELDALVAGLVLRPVLVPAAIRSAARMAGYLHARLLKDTGSRVYARLPAALRRRVRQIYASRVATAVAYGALTVASQAATLYIQGELADPARLREWGAFLRGPFRANPVGTFGDPPAATPGAVLDAPPDLQALLDSAIAQGYPPAHVAEAAAKLAQAQASLASAAAEWATVRDAKLAEFDAPIAAFEALKPLHEASDAGYAGNALLVRAVMGVGQFEKTPDRGTFERFFATQAQTNAANLAARADLITRVDTEIAKIHDASTQIQDAVLAETRRSAEAFVAAKEAGRFGVLPPPIAVPEMSLQAAQAFAPPQAGGFADAVHPAPIAAAPAPAQAQATAPAQDVAAQAPTQGAAVSAAEQAQVRAALGAQVAAGRVSAQKAGQWAAAIESGAIQSLAQTLGFTQELSALVKSVQAFANLRADVDPAKYALDVDDKLAAVRAALLDPQKIVQQYSPDKFAHCLTDTGAWTLGVDPVTGQGSVIDQSTNAPVRANCAPDALLVGVLGRVLRASMDLTATAGASYFSGGILGATASTAAVEGLIGTWAVAAGEYTKKHCAPGSAGGLDCTINELAAGVLCTMGFSSSAACQGFVAKMDMRVVAPILASPEGRQAMESIGASIVNIGGLIQSGGLSDLVGTLQGAGASLYSLVRVAALHPELVVGTPNASTMYAAGRTLLQTIDAEPDAALAGLQTFWGRYSVEMLAAPQHLLQQSGALLGFLGRNVLGLNARPASLADALATNAELADARFKPFLAALGADADLTALLRAPNSGLLAGWGTAVRTLIVPDAEVWAREQAKGGDALARFVSKDALTTLTSAAYDVEGPFETDTGVLWLMRARP